MSPPIPARPGRPRATRVAAALVLALSLTAVSALGRVAAQPAAPGVLAPPRAVMATVTGQVSAAVAVLAPAGRLPAPPAWDGAVAPPVSAAAAVVVDGATGALLYGKDAHRRLPPASITKTVTAMVALERGRLDDVVTVMIDGLAFAIATDSSIMGLLPGDRLTLRDLLYGLMLPSGNDAAVAIATHLAGSEEIFVGWMNAKVAQLGLHNTHFANVHGLHDPDHYTTAYDISQLSLWAMMNADFRAIAAAPLWTVHGSRTYTVTNLNPLLWAYPGADGVKTGWHEQAGPTITGSAVRDGRRLFVTLLDSPRQIADSRALLDWAFGHFSREG